MDQTSILTISVPLFAGSIGLTWFLLARAPRLPRELSNRSKEAAVRLRLASSTLLRDLRSELNIALQDYDRGDDPYLTRVNYQVPSATLKQYRKLMILESAARKAPNQVLRRIRLVTIVSIVLTALFLTTAILASLESFIGLFYSYCSLALSGTVVIAGLILSLIFFARPYMNVSKSEARGLSEISSRPSLRVMAEALGVAPETIDGDDSW